MRKKIIIILTVVSCIFMAFFIAGCSNDKSDKDDVVEKREVTVFSFDIDISDKTEGFCVGASKLNKVLVDGNAVDKNDYVVRNDYLLLKNGIYSELGVGTHKIAVYYSSTDNTEFTLNIVDNKQLVFDTTELENIVIPFNNPILPEVYFESAQERTVTYSLSKGEKTFSLTDNANGKAFVPDSLGAYNYSVVIQRKNEKVFERVYSVKVVNDDVYDAFVANGAEYTKNKNIFVFNGDEIGIKFSGSSLDDYKDILNVIGDVRNNYNFDFKENYLGLEIKNNHDPIVTYLENVSCITGVKIYGSFLKDCVENSFNKVLLNCDYVSAKSAAPEYRMNLYYFDQSANGGLGEYVLLQDKLLIGFDMTKSKHGDLFFSIDSLACDEGDYLLLDIPNNGNVVRLNSLTFTKGLKEVNAEIYFDDVKQSEEVCKNISSKLFGLVNVKYNEGEPLSVLDVADLAVPAFYSVDGSRGTLTTNVVDNVANFTIYYNSKENVNLIENEDTYKKNFEFIDALNMPKLNSANYSTSNNSVIFSKEAGWNVDGVVGIKFNENLLKDLIDNDYIVINVTYSIITLKTNVTANSSFVPVLVNNLAIIEQKGFGNANELNTSITATFTLSKDFLADGTSLVLHQKNPGTQLKITSITASKLPIDVSVSCDVYLDGVLQEQDNWSSLLKDLSHAVNKNKLFNINTVDVTEIAEKYVPMNYDIDTNGSILTCTITGSSVKFEIRYAKFDEKIISDTEWIKK